MSKFYGTKERIREMKTSWLGSTQDLKHKIYVVLQDSYYKCALMFLFKSVTQENWFLIYKGLVYRVFDPLHTDAHNIIDRPY